jgi:hypothetical protein
VRERGGILALLAALGAIGHFSAPKARLESAGAQTSVSSGVVAASQDELEKTFSKFDKHRAYSLDFGSGLPHFKAKRLPYIVSGGEPVFDWAIATVRDPEHTPLRLDFDREIEAIQLASAAANYQFERYWFPWRADGAIAGRDVRYLIAERRGRAEITQQEDDLRSSLPGVLLFRPHDEAQKRRALAIFLVSEAPVGGIAPLQFRTAVSLGRSLRTLSGQQDDHRLVVIGPSCSGSLDSLATLILSEKPSFKSASVNTWTTGHSSQDAFREKLEHSLSLDLQASEIQETAAINTFVNYVRNTWNDREPILILTEEQTAFGANLNPPPSKHLNHQITDKHVFTVTFPRNLSRLRNASETQDRNGADARDAEVPHTGLLLSLKEESEDEEIPTFSRQQTPLSQESVLFTIGKMLKTGVIHYAGIFATDSLDTLFLARYLRSACPNLRLFTGSPDLLLEHGSDSSEYSGIFSLSRYPLFPFSQLWSGTQGTLHVFPSADAEAAYNSTIASLRLLAGNSQGGPYQRDQDGPYVWSPQHLWIAVAGRNGFEPVAVLDPQHPAAPPPGSIGLPKGIARVPRLVPEYWPIWGYALMALLALCCLYCAAALLTNPHSGRTIAMFSAQPQQFASSEHAAAHVFFVSAIGLSLSVAAIIWLVASGVILQQNFAIDQLSQKPVRQPDVATFGAVLLCAGLVAILILASKFISAPPFLPERWRRPFRHRGWKQRAAAGIAGCLLVLSPVRSWPDWSNHPGHALPHLWLYYLAASAIAGCTLAGSLVPVWGFVAARKTGAHAVHTRQAPYLVAEALITVFAVFICAFAYVTVARGSPLDFLAAYRSLDLTDGVSPLVPIALLLIVFAATAFAHLRRIANFEDRRPDVPDMRDDQFCPKLNQVVFSINRRLSEFRPQWADLLAALAVCALAAYLFGGSFQTLETRPLDCLIISFSFAAAAFIFIAWIRLLLVWTDFSTLLQQLERHPVREVFSLLPRGFMWSPVWQGGGKKRTHVLATRSLECLRALAAHGRTPAEMRDRIHFDFSELEQNVIAVLDASAGHGFNRTAFRRVEQLLQTFANTATGLLRKAKWSHGGYELKSELANKEETRDALHVTTPEYAVEEPLIVCSELVAYRFIAYINFVLWHVDNLVAYISGGFLLLVIALNSYSFRSKTVIDGALVLGFTTLTAGIVTVFSHADRDAILSRITGTEEGKLDRHFFMHLVSYGALPLLVLLATHFPSVGRFFFSWVKPALEAIH